MLYLPYSLTSGWVERRRLKAAVERDMGVIAYDYYPKTFHGAGGAAPKSGGWIRGQALSQGRPQPRAQGQLALRPAPAPTPS